MLAFYLDIGRRIFVSLFKAAGIVETVFGLVVFFLARFNKQLFSSITEWEGVHPGWAWVILGVLFLHLFLREVFAKYRDLEQNKDEDIDQLQSDLQRERSEFVRRGEAFENEIKTVERKRDEHVATLQGRSAMADEKNAARVKELEKQVADLQSGMLKLDQNNKRLELARQQLIECANSAKAVQMLSDMRAWSSGAEVLTGRILINSHGFHGLSISSFREDRPLDEDHKNRLSIGEAAIRAIAINLRVQDLRGK